MGSVDAPVGGLPHEEEDFGKTLLDMLGSPRAHFSNGLNTLFSPEIHSNSNYDLLMSHGSLGSPDFTTQLNSAGLHDFSLGNNGRQPSLLPPLQLPSQPVWPGGWSADSWLPQSPTCPTLSLSPLPNVGYGSSFGNGSSLNGGSFHVGQLLASQDNELLQPSEKPGEAPVAPAELAATQSYAPVTPTQQQLLPQLAPPQQQGLPFLQPQQTALELQLQQQEQYRTLTQYQQQHHVQLPPGLWLVAPTAHQAAPAVVQQSLTLTAAADNAVMQPHEQQHQQQHQRQQQQQGRKRQLGQQQADAGRRKAARAGKSTSPSAAAAAATAGADVQPILGGSSFASPVTPTVPAANAAAGGDVRVSGGSGKAPTSSKAETAQLETGALVWGKVNRYPWWPAVVIPPSTEDEPAPAPTAAAAAAPSAAAKHPPVFVRFLGTHDTAWLEAGKASAWHVQLSERSSKTKAAAFVNALREGRTYAATGALPGVFCEVLPGAVKHQDDSQHSDTDSGSAGEDQQQQSRPSRHSHSRSLAATPGTSGSHHLAADIEEEGAHHSSSSLRPSRADAGAAVAAVESGAEGQDKAEAGQHRSDKARVAAKRRREPPAAARVSTRSVLADVRQTRSGRQLRGS